jgi:5-aminolevulinate synthase
MGSGFIFTTSLPPAICAAATKSIEYLRENKLIRPAYRKKVNELRAVLKSYRIPFLSNDTHITPIPVGDEKRCKQISDYLLFQQGIYIQPIIYPTVKKGEACLRITITSKHGFAEMEKLGEALEKAFQVFPITDINLPQQKQSVTNS